MFGFCCCFDLVGVDNGYGCLFFVVCYCISFVVIIEFVVGGCYWWSWNGGYGGYGFDLWCFWYSIYCCYCIYCCYVGYGGNWWDGCWMCCDIVVGFGIFVDYGFVVFDDDDVMCGWGGVVDGWN